MNTSKIPVALASFRRFALARAFRVAWTQTGRASRLIWRGELSHIDANLRNDGPRGDPLDAGHRTNRKMCAS